MDSSEFKPSIDWSNELLASTLWVLKTFGITAICLAVILVLLGRLTTWGRQFWRLSGPYFTASDSRRVVWAMLAGLWCRRSSPCGSACCSAITATICSRRCRWPSRATSSRAAR